MENLFGSCWWYFFFFLQQRNIRSDNKRRKKFTKKKSIPFKPTLFSCLFICMYYIMLRMPHSDANLISDKNISTILSKILFSSCVNAHSIHSNAHFFFFLFFSNCIRFNNNNKNISIHQQLTSILTKFHILPNYQRTNEKKKKEIPDIWIYMEVVSILWTNTTTNLQISYNIFILHTTNRTYFAWNVHKRDTYIHTHGSV